MNKRLRKPWRWAVIFLAASVLPWLGACKKDEATPLSIRNVVAYEVKVEAKGGGLFYSGDVRSRIESTLGFRIAGKLLDRRVNLGDRVKSGQVLARLDKTDPALAAQAAGNQRAAAEAEMDLARIEVKRFEALRVQNFVSQAALDAKMSALKAAENRTAAARAQAESAGNQTGYADLIADADGVVSAVLAEPGQVLAVGAPVLRLARIGNNDKEVLIAVPEDRVSDFSMGKDVMVSLWANSQKQYRGRIRELSPQADLVTRTFAAKIAILDADEEVRLGMTATVMLSGVAQNILQVPSASIVQKDGSPAVWILGEDGSIRLQAVKVAAYLEDGVVLSEGLMPGQKIVAAGGHKLMPGERVRILEAR